MSKIRVYLFLSVLAFLMPAQTVFAQYFQSLFDCDSTQDWGYNIFLNSDSGLFTINISFNSTNNTWDVASLNISSNGLSIMSKKMIGLDNSYVFIGNPGEVKKIQDGNYICPLSIQNPNFYYINTKAGFMKLSQTGDTIFMKTYFDTTPNATWLYCASVLPNGHIMGGGAIGGNWSDYYSGLIICADSLGDTLWTKSYLIDTGHNVTINTIEPLDNSRILVGATRDTRVEYDFSEWIDFNAPWFLIIDTNGNILKDTLYSYTHYWERLGGVEGGHLYKDKNGGFFHYGRTSTITDLSDLNNLHNCPTYFAHLDSDFRITWIDSFPYSDTFGRRLIYKMYQTDDSCYMLGGSFLKDSDINTLYGWLAKIGRDGHMLWERYYLSDSGQPHYIEDIVEKPDKSFVLYGSAYNDTLPTWHDQLDVWLVGVDSLGCNVGGCWWPTETNDVQIRDDDISIYPNPTTGNLTALSTQAGSFEVYTVTGQLIGRYLISAGATTLQLPGMLASGVYIGSFRPEGGGKPSNIRIVLRP